MLLAVDIGNTNVVLGLYRGEDLVAHWRLSSHPVRTADEYGLLLADLLEHKGYTVSDLTGVAVASVVPALTQAFQAMCGDYLGMAPLIIGPGVRTGMPIRYENPREVGADRIVNAVAAYEKVRGAVVVIDFGTATTFDVVSAAGEYLGGAIAPGIGVSTEALFARAAKLPRVELVRPPSVIGRNTITSMQAGIVYGFAGQVDHLVTCIRQELGTPAEALATGGLAPLIAGVSQTIRRIEPFLTLEGIRLIYERNGPGQRQEASPRHE
ncbi:MAG: type III pantothenate kinase [Clostridia bacterium]|nr:type III pantothenate kinase [Clostridia bacterium]